MAGLRNIMLVLIGFGEGIVVGVSLVAFLMVLDVIPRLIQFSNSKKYVKIYHILIISGSFLGTNIQFYNLKLPEFYINELIVIIAGFIFGSFIGLVAAALTEILKVLPILSRRLGLTKEIKRMLSVIIIGKLIGSLLYWLFPILWS